MNPHLNLPFALTPENLTLCREYHLNLGVRASVAPSCSLCLCPSTGHQTPSSTPPYGCLLRRASPSHQQPHTILQNFWESTLSSTCIHCLGDLHQLMQAFNLLASVPVEGEDSITRLLQRCLSKWLDMGKVKNRMAGLAWKPPLPATGYLHL